MKGWQPGDSSSLEAFELKTFVSGNQNDDLGAVDESIQEIAKRTHRTTAAIRSNAKEYGVLRDRANTARKAKYTTEARTVERTIANRKMGIIDQKEEAAEQ